MAGRARPKVRVAHRWIMGHLARDVTDQSTTLCALVVAPHPDDETIGCGATIARKTAAGTDVHVVVVSDGGEGGRPPGETVEAFTARRAEECIEACHRLGVPRDCVKFLGFEDTRLSEHVDEIGDLLRSVVAAVRPQEVIVPLYVDAHADHHAVGLAVDGLLTGALAPCTVRAYPLWFWNRWAWTTPSRPRWLQWLDLAWKPIVTSLTLRPCKVRASGYLGQKREALAAYESQTVNTLDAEWLEQFFFPQELFFTLATGSHR